MYHLKVIVVGPIMFVAFCAGFVVRAVKDAFEFGGDEFDEFTDEVHLRVNKEGKTK
jgi:hypothetical protein